MQNFFVIILVVCWGCISCEGELQEIIPSVGNIVCPDGNTECANTETCCFLTSGKYGCCPYSSAVCCSDHIHCCPYGYICQLPNCIPRQKFIHKELTKTHPATSLVQYVLRFYDSETICDNTESRCPESNTCCAHPDGDFTCCPYKDASCCSDGLHCCPQGYVCNSQQQKCVQELKETKAVKKIVPNSFKDLFLSLTRKKITKISDLNKKVKNTESEGLANVLCPDKMSECPSGNTCCKLSSGQYGCCPLPGATCCSDGVHCCPNGYTCNGEFCTKGDEVIKALKHTTSLKKGENIVCPDGQSQCPSGNTCCKLSSGQYGCCPLPGATCCSDGVHCCPNGYTCSGGFCAKGDEVIKAFKHTMSLKKVGNVICPDGQSECPDGNTCCKLSSGQYGCCPLPKATCCSDGVHCCPSGYTCNAGFCTKGDEVIKAFKHTTSVKKVGVVVCPDGQSECPDGNTCCKLSSGQWGCCPLPKATCCSDGVHCCPNGYACNGGSCTKGDIVIKASKHTIAIRKFKDNICPDGISECPDGNTCCKSSDGSYACCPLPNAVCCSDRVHCCPHGYTCDAAGGTCNLNGHVIKSSKSFLASIRSRKIENPFVVHITSSAGRKEKTVDESEYVTF